MLRGEVLSHIDNLRRDRLWCSVSALEMTVYLFLKPKIAWTQFWDSYWSLSEQKLINSTAFLYASKIVDCHFKRFIKHHIEVVLETSTKKSEGQPISIDYEDANSTAFSKPSTNKRQLKINSTRTINDSNISVSSNLDLRIAPIPPESFTTFYGRISKRRWGSKSFV